MPTNELLTITLYELQFVCFEQFERSLTRFPWNKIMNTTTKYEVKCKLKKGDEVVVLTGKSKGEKGKVDRIDKKKGRIFVGGVNISKRHTKPSGAKEGGIVDKVMSLDVSNVALVDPKSGKATKIGYKMENEKKVRFAKDSGRTLT